ncbi:MAG: SusC/RagA family TonB-linked outer membrane protein [Ginsengibacter sp.]
MKKLIQNLLLCTFLCFCALIASAQQKNVTGTVKDNNGMPVANATVLVKGTKTGTSTDDKGDFSVSVNGSDATLLISSVNYKSEEVKVGQNSHLEVALEGGAGTMQEVVVTALGVQKTKKSLGYAVQEVKGTSLVEAREVNVVNDLSGKVAGLQVTRSGSGPGGSSKITLRGNNSLTGDNQPLIVVDGIPMQNATGRVGIGGTNDFYNPSLDMGNGLSDINPDDIATLTVLKGPAASALYGSRAGNGVILITTKTGKKEPGLGITLSSSIGVSNIFTNPGIQNSFAQGSNGLFDPNSQLSWGPKIAGQIDTAWDGQAAPLKAYNNVKNFFQTGITSNQNISFQQKYKSVSIYTSYNRMDDKGITPGQKLTRNNLTARAITKFGNKDRWSIDTKIQYINSIANNRSLVGQNINNAFTTIYDLPRSIDITQFRQTLDSAGNMRWFSPKNTVNPYWASKYNLNQDTRNRFLMYGALKYQFTDWLIGEINGGTDMYTENTQSTLYAGSPVGISGSYGIGKQTYQETDYSTMFTAHKDNLFGKLGGSVMVGGNLSSTNNSAINANTGALTVPNLFTLGNSAGKPSISQGFSQKRINSLYGSIELNYDGYLYLTGTFRNDWSSALSPANRSYSYPSISASYVFTDMINKHGGHLPSWISFGKIRASYASVGNDLDPYQLYNTYSIGNDPNGNTTAGRNSILFNPNVKSELIKSYEVGANMRFFDNRLGFDLALYKSNATRQLINLPLDPLSGYSYEKVNTGDIENKGIELTLDAAILDSHNPKSLNWNMSLNYSTNDNTVNSIYPGVDKYQLGGYDQIQVLAVAGQKYGEIYGTTLQRVTDPKDPNYGKLILDANGLPQKASGAVVKLGNQQANALLGLTNSFSYKNFGFSFLIDGRFGGKMFSGTLDNMERAGTAVITLGDGSRDSMLVSGVVLNSGNNQYDPNTKKVSTQQYWGATAGADNIGITETNLYDATNIRIRNIQVSYNLPHKLLGKSFIQRAGVSVTVNNVWLITSHMHGLDPDSVYATGTNATGFENGSSPTSRTFFFNLNLGF